jgi:putative colanic acid biosynthesis acetyltransferase WcaF
MNNVTNKVDLLLMRIEYQDLSKHIVPKNFRGRNVFVVQLWWLVQCTLFAFSPQFMYAWKRFLLRLFGAKIGGKVLIRPSA